MFDIDSGDLDNDLSLFDGVLEALEQNSSDASIFVLIHKMDLVTAEDRERAFNERGALIQSRSEQYVFTLVHCVLYGCFCCQWSSLQYP